MQRDPQLCGERVKTAENCSALLRYAQQLTQGDEGSIEQRIIGELPFLQEKPDEHNIYIVQPSGGSVSVDLQTAVRLFSMKKDAIEQVAVMAACYLGQQVAEGFDKQLDEAAK